MLRARYWLALPIVALSWNSVPAVAQTVLTPRVTLTSPAIDDQDDLCVWIHPANRSLSTIVTADKAANELFVYDLAGGLIQQIPVDGQPGNIDVRYDFPFGSSRVDIVALNERAGQTIQVFAIDPGTRLLSRIDAGTLASGPNYGFCLYRSRASDTHYAFTTSSSGLVKQFELRGDGGTLTATPVRSFDLGGQTEGCVCDDETGRAYFGEETGGIWVLGAEPDDAFTASLIAETGDASGLTADVEGLAIYYARGGNGYLIASSQGNSQFKAYDRRPPHALLSSFSIAGVSQTDGIDVASLDFGDPFATGLFAAHNGAPSRKTVVVCAFGDVGLPIDPGYWDPRLDETTSVAPANTHAEPRSVLAGARPNPVRDELVVEFSLASAGPATLDLFDLAGRRAWSRHLNALPPGAHRVNLGSVAHLPAGVYLLRLAHGNTSLTTRAVIAR